MIDTHSKRRPLRYVAASGIAAITVFGTMLGGTGAAAAATPAASSRASAATAQSLITAAQSHSLIGVPSLPRLVAGNIAKLSSPEYWFNWVHEALDHNKWLLPLPTDVVKPDVVLPHSEVDKGSYVSAMPEDNQNLGSVTYSWEGRTKTVSDFLRDSESDELLFMKNGTVEGEFFANGWTQNDAHQGWSTTKSFVSTLVGEALAQGRISSLDDPIDKYVPELANTAWKGTTIRNLLTMRSGIKWDEEAENLSDNTQFTEWIDLALDYYTNGKLGQTRNEYISSLPRVAPQGTEFNYNSANPQILAWMLEKLYGQKFNTILSQQLWQPLGMQKAGSIMVDRQGDAIASEELFATDRDFARLGELWRNGGRTSRGHQLLSQAYITAATTSMQPAKDTGDTKMGGYGYLWWSGATTDGYQADGFQGNYITVAPSAGMTGVRLAHTIQFDNKLQVDGMGNQEWHAVYNAVLAKLAKTTD